MRCFLSKNEIAMIYSKQRRSFARAESGIMRCNGLKLKEKGVCVGWEIKTILTVRAIKQWNGLNYCKSELSQGVFELDKVLEGVDWEAGAGFDDLQDLFHCLYGARNMGQSN